MYSTNEPQNAFHVRIAFCLDTHNEAVKAMRYPPKKDKAAIAARAVPLMPRPRSI